MTVTANCKPGLQCTRGNRAGGSSQCQSASCRSPAAAKNMNTELSAEPKLKAMPSDEYKNGLLSRGKATGGIRYATPDGRGKLQVRIGGRGRGLFASSTIEKSMLNVLNVSLCKKSFI
jgi:hypothetical protein